MVAGLFRVWAIAAAVSATAAGSSLHRRGATSGDDLQLADFHEGNAVSMLAKSEAEHPLSWLFGGVSANTSPAESSGSPSMQTVQMNQQQPVFVTGMPSVQPMPIVGAVPPSPLVAAAPPQGIAQPQQLVSQTPMAQPPVAQPQLAQPPILPVASPQTPMLGIVPVAGAPSGAPMPPPPGAIPLSALFPTKPPAKPKPAKPPAASTQEVAQMRTEITELRQEVVNGNKDMWNAVKLIMGTVEKDESTMKALTQDVRTLRGRHGGSVPLVADECTMRQSSCSECLSVPSCVWCKVEQRCYVGDSAGPVRGECAFFKHGTCG